MSTKKHEKDIPKKEVNGLWVLLFFILMLIAVGILAKFTL